MHLRDFARKIDNLTPNSKPKWGKMTPQHMVEHLSDTMKIAIGEIDIPVYTPENQLAEMRRFLMSDRALPRGVVSPAIGSELPKLRNESFEDALKEFWKYVYTFEKYYTENPDATHINPAFGNLTYPEWLQFMSKHFTHHFEQFGLIN
ncbi:MAG: DUF1569 domain-containing protein [Cyclonatronaceae bacterium]